MSKRTSYGKNYRSDVRFIRTCTHIHVYPADEFFPIRGRIKNRVHADALVRPRRPMAVRTRVDTRRVANGSKEHAFRGAELLGFRTIKRGALPLFPHFQPIPVK
jgi:hypothetical protein